MKISRLIIIFLIFLIIIPAAVALPQWLQWLGNMFGGETPETPAPPPPAPVEPPKKTWFDPRLWEVAKEACQETVMKIREECVKHENWFVDVMIGVTDHETGDHDASGYINRGGRCPNYKPEDPIDIKGEFIDILGGRYEVVCSFTCYGWKCPVFRRPELVTPRPKPPTVTPKPQEPVQEPAPPKPKSCEELCAERGLSTKPVDHTQFISSSLQQKRCISGARISLKGTTTLKGPNFECKCYSQEKPRIEIDSTPPSCQTPCGPVKCDESAQCPCPDKPNCILTASCAWQGWKVERGRAIPLLGAKASAAAQG